MNRPGAAPQALRAMPGNVFTNQPQSSNSTRSGSLGSGRLQNGKIAGTANTWGFGINTAGASVLNNAQSRSANKSNLSGFAQAIGTTGTQAHTALDPSEFPSLSGAPQPQTQNSNSQAIWGSSGGIRAQQPANNQRPPNQHNQQHASQTIRPPSQSSHPQQRQSDPQTETHAPQFSPQGQNIEDYRFGQDVGVRSNRSNEHQGNTEEFPPLGGLGAASAQNAGSASYQSNQLPYRASSGADQQLYSQQSHQQNEHLGRRHTDTPNDVHTSPMSEVDQWGLPGLLETLRGRSRDQASLLLGIDLNELGLDLHRPDNSALYSDWAGPFADPGARPIIPDFTLPPAYTVHNVPPLHSKIGSFSDETLFVIFYQSPRDEAQEMAANELYQRDWRWHKKLQQWMMKAKEFGEPVVSQTRQEERGYYYFWDVTTWRRERKEFILSYEHLHHGQAVSSHNMSSM